MFAKINAKFVKELTINYCNSAQYINDPARLLKVVSLLQSMLKHYGLDYELYPEVSTPNVSQKGHPARVHFHGIITWSSSVDYFEFWSDKLHKLNKFCRVSISDIRDNQEWYKYCTKDSYMKEVCKEYGITYPLTPNKEHILMTYKEHCQDWDVESQLYDYEDDQEPQMVKPKRKYRRKQK